MDATLNYEDFEARALEYERRIERDYRFGEPAEVVDRKIERIRQIASGELRQYESDRARIVAILQLIANWSDKNE